MTFTRQEHRNWQLDIPGVRWFKADLHIHTIDDLPGSRAKMPSGINGDPQSPETISAYARRFLKSAVEQRVQVLGITPHSSRVGTSEETSAVWQIVEEWNNGVGDDGTPFREKIYAVFPGFEPSLRDGKSGLHILFLFDPEIGRANYLKAFDLVMGGVSPWPNGPDNGLKISNKDAEEAFRDLLDFHKRECPKSQDGSFQWHYLALAPHIENDKGLLGAQKAQVLELFQHDAVAGLELGDHKLPYDTINNRPWLPEAMAEHHQAFFHSSDAYSVDEIGKRHTWIKLASPRIEALRQAFIASDSRMRIGYERDADGKLSEIPNPPDVTMNQRPWLKSVTVSGKASFFGSGGTNGETTRFDLSPDLTCVIGGSMTGKSTFLDGLRVHIGADMPQDPSIKNQVEARGKDRFLVGSAKVVLDCISKDPTANLKDQWPAVFYAQSELQHLAQNPDTPEEILTSLVPSETQELNARKARLEILDKELSKSVRQFAGLRDNLAEAEQAFDRSKKAASELAAFSNAGAENLHQASSYLQQWQEFAKVAKDVEVKLGNLTTDVVAVDLPILGEGTEDAVKGMSVSENITNFCTHWNRAIAFLCSAKEELKAAGPIGKHIIDTLETHVQNTREKVERKLAENGFPGAIINQLQALNDHASSLDGHEANLNRARQALTEAESLFKELRSERQNLVIQQREAFDRVIETVRSQFDGKIAVRRVNDGHKEPLANFLKGFSQAGITRWLNNSAGDQMLTPDILLAALDNNNLAEVGMSPAVQETFYNQMTPLKRYEMAAIRCRDQYVLELNLDDGSYRPLMELSGGQRVSLLLTLLLETNDERPLVIDQPEDELDNRFLFNTMLPALKRLKGRRQIIVATHSANIVVNGDADQVIHLEATANQGKIASAGAIEEPAIRDAIVRTVDGGEDAFRMRRLKYGF